MSKHVGEVEVNTAALEQWKYALPALAERCRTWAHKSTCEYVKPGKMPQSTAYARQFLCKCGMDVFPNNFIKDPPEWSVLRKHAVRVAIPLYYKSLFNTDEPTTRSTQAASSTSLPSRAKAPTPEEVASVAKKADRTQEVPSKLTGHCVGCGAVERADGTALLSCQGCKCAKYCSRECQKQDWQKWHKKMCPILKEVGWEGLDRLTGGA
jgi:hypothetical protein